MNVGFVFTSFNNTKYTAGVLSSIAKSDADMAPVVIVDNGSCEKEVELLRMLEAQYKNLTVLYNEKNLGYFSGLNVGINYIKSNMSHATHLIVGNNDLIFPSDINSKLDHCINIFNKYPVVSPNIQMLDGTPQNPHVISSISKIRELIYDIYHSSYLLAKFVVFLAKITSRFTDRKDEQQHEIAQEIYQGYGACYILSPKFFEHFSELESVTFLMYEEFFLAKQLNDIGFKIFYEPRILVTHHCHASTGQLPGKLRWEISKKAHKEYRKHVKYWR